jgi:hypothetical protein
MRITPVPHGLEDIVGVSPGGRTTHKLHMSDIYGRYYELWDKRKFNQDIQDAKPLYMEAGLAFESLLEDALKKRLAGERPGELVTENNIVYSPDLIIFDSGITRLGEIKVTWMSLKDIPDEECNSFPPKFNKYFTQMMLYCHALETPYSRLIGFFVNGNYKPPAPQLRAWDIEFTKREIDEEWRKMMNFARTEGMLC